MTSHAQNLDEYGMDLLQSMVALEPHKRISCRMALQHPYFDDLDKSKLVKEFWEEDFLLEEWANYVQ